MLPKLIVKTHNYNTSVIPLYPEGVAKRQERILMENIKSISRKIMPMLEDLDNDCSQTIELDLFGAIIYVDVATKGWDYRSVELLAVDIMNDENDALDTAANALFNLLGEEIFKMNAKMDALYENYNS